MLKSYRADLHIHSCLSPCGDLEMTPLRIVSVAIKLGLDLIAITDHNSSENVAAAMKAAHGTSLTVLAGMEVTSSEEVHLLVFFDDLELMEKFQSLIYDHLISFDIDQRMIGEQIIVNEKDEVEGFNERLLLGATSLSLDELVEQVHYLQGLVVASHVDKEGYSIIAQLGFIPEHLKLDALEISPFMEREEARQKFPDCNRFPLVTFSDAHYLRDIGSRTSRFTIKAPTINELKKVLTNNDERLVLY